MSTFYEFFNHFCNIRVFHVNINIIDTENKFIISLLSSGESGRAVRWAGQLAEEQVNCSKSAIIPKPLKRTRAVARRRVVKQTDITRLSVKYSLILQSFQYWISGDFLLIDCMGIIFLTVIECFVLFCPTSGKDSFLLNDAASKAVICEIMRYVFAG